MDDFERRWQMIKDLLLDEANGAKPRRISSGRTLFGIQSEAEKTIARVAREIEQDNLAQLEAERERRRRQRESEHAPEHAAKREATTDEEAPCAREEGDPDA